MAGETAAVLGVGSLGLLAVQVLRARGCRVLAVARTTKRLDLALALGAEAVALSGADDDTAAARAFSGREGVDLVIETAGTALAVEQAVNLCRPGGRVVLTGLPHEATSLNFFWVVRRELRIIGSMIYQDEFPEAIRLLATGAVQGARYAYSPATPEMLAKVARIEAVCAHHGVPIAAAALQFPLGHPLVASVIPGGLSPEHVRQNVAAFRHVIPSALWTELKHEGLLRADAPTP